MIWKLLRQHISPLQLLGFFLANLLGVFVVLLAMQFYNDVRPIFSQNDGFISNDYIILSKRISTTGLTASTFSDKEIEELASQPFARNVGAFTASQYQVSCSMGIQGMATFGTQMYFESVPDQFVDTHSQEWHYEPGNQFVPIILPRNYLAIYNFGFAQSRSLPRLSEGLVSTLELMLVLRGQGKEQRMKGRVVGFTTRLNTILAPQSFIDWSNAEFAPQADTSPTRLILEVGNTADERIVKYAQSHGYDVDDDRLQAGKATYVLKIVSGIVMAVGLLITLLSFFILMLSIYLLVQKNTRKLQTLLLLGYSPARVSLPYQLLTVGINVLVLLLALALLWWLRGHYMKMLWSMFPTMPSGSYVPTIILGVALCLLVSVLNIIALRRKILGIWKG